jgi:CubicO group peptidase (beta-lactamase class C family)
MNRSGLLRFAGVLLAFGLFTPTTLSADLASDLDAIFTSAYPSDQPGGAVIVEQDGKVILRKAYGMADLELGVPLAPDMVFRLGSITKQFTAVLVLQLVQEGKLSAEDPLSKYLPDFPAAQAEGVTVQHLVNHTSGIPSYTDQPTWPPRMREDLTVQQILDFTKDLPRDFAPGTQWKYSNTGYILLGAILEKVTGKAYATLVAERIFEPLGMTSSSYGAEERIIPRRVKGYDGGPGAYQNTSYLSMTQPYAAGSLLSTVDDLAKWNSALLGERIARPPFRDQLWQSAKLADGRDTHYAWGWGVWEYEGHRVISHSGGINGFVTDALRVPDAKLFVAVLSNNPGAAKRPEELTLTAAALVLGKPLDQRPSIRLSAEKLEEFTGVYEIDGNPEMLRVITRDGDTLYSQRSGSAKFEIRPRGGDRFFFLDTVSELQFERDASGKVTGHRMIRNVGADESAKKVNRPIPTAREEIQLDPATLDGYLGEFELAPGFSIAITREGDALFAQATGQPRFPLFAETKDRLFLKVVDAVIDFERDATGTVTGIVLRQGGQNLPGKRKG